MTGMVVQPYWRAEDGPPRRVLRLVRPFGSRLVRTTWKVRVHDAHHVPESGPVILAANHIGFLDGPLVWAAVRRPVHALVKREMFRGVVGRALRAIGQIPVDRQAVDIAAVKACLAVLERGDVLAIYPEGTRGAGDFSTIKPGVAYLALCTGAPVVPVACLGTRQPGRPVGSVPRPRSRLDVVFGRPVRLDLTPWPRRQALVREQARWLQKWLMAHVGYACEKTGQALPGPASRVEPGLGPTVASDAGQHTKDVS